MVLKICASFHTIPKPFLQPTLLYSISLDKNLPSPKMVFAVAQSGLVEKERWRQTKQVIINLIIMKGLIMIIIINNLIIMKDLIMVSKLFYVGRRNSSFVLHVTQLGLFGYKKGEKYWLLCIKENTDGLHDSHNQFRRTCEHSKLRDVRFVQWIKGLRIKEIFNAKM